jgi:hypothetical protein
MATHIYSRPRILGIPITRPALPRLHFPWQVRRCMVISVGLMLLGLSIPALMLFNILPASLLLGFIGLVLIGIGGVLTLVYCGEI